jgi:hypothetical protein
MMRRGISSHDWVLAIRWQAEVDALKRLQAETAAELDALLHALLDCAFKKIMIQR